MTYGLGVAVGKANVGVAEVTGALGDGVGVGDGDGVGDDGGTGVGVGVGEG